MLYKAIYPTLTFAAGLFVGTLAAERYDSPVKSGDQTVELEGRETDGALEDTTTAFATTNAAQISAPQHPVEQTKAKETQDRWQRLDEELYELRQRIQGLEETLAAWERTTSAAAISRNETEDSSARQDRSAQRRDALVAAGVSQDWAADILRRLSEEEMKRLEIRDQALREDWMGNERFFNALRELGDATAGLRAEIGDEAYDRYLYTLGETNRVLIDSVIQGSPAEDAGLQAGDIILDYADRRMFNWSDLRNATSDGERGEPVFLRVRRNEQTVDLSIPRGPMGVRLDSASVNPDG